MPTKDKSIETPKWKRFWDILPIDVVAYLSMKYYGSSNVLLTKEDIQHIAETELKSFPNFK